jgi:hypothetical protein
VRWVGAEAIVRRLECPAQILREDYGQPEALPVGQRDESRESLDILGFRMGPMQNTSERGRLPLDEQAEAARVGIEFRRQIVLRSEQSPVVAGNAPKGFELIGNAGRILRIC